MYDWKGMNNMQQTEIRELIKYAQEVFGLELELIKSKEPMTFEKIFGVVDSEKDYDTYIDMNDDYCNDKLKLNLPLEKENIYECNTKLQLAS